MKKRIKVNLLSTSELSVVTADVVSEKLDRLQKYKIEELNWPSFGYKPSVSFSIAYQEKYIFLKYFVSEKHVRAIYQKPNDPVYKDSCVEFFVSLGEGKGYYNFEFNSNGTCLASYRESKADRQFLPEQVIRKIRYKSTFKAGGGDDGLPSWELTLIFPLEVFKHHQLESFRGLKGKANFYKCGDELPEPHFLSWNPIHTEHPDFHQPEYFGEIEFSDIKDIVSSVFDGKTKQDTFIK